MLRLRVLPPAALFLLFCCSPGSSLAARLPDHLEEDFAKGWRPEWRLFVADMDQDGNDEILTAGNNFVLCERFSAGSLLPMWQANFRTPGELQADIYSRRIWDATGDGSPDLLVVSESEDRTFWVRCYDPLSPQGPSYAIYEIGPFLKGCRPGQDGGTGTVAVVGCFDADGDGRSEVYVGSFPFVPGVEPRRLYAFDGASGKPLWNVDLAAVAGQALLLTRQDGGERHIVLGTYAPGNDFEVGGRTDHEACVISLTPRGGQEWCVPLGGTFAAMHLALADLDGDDEQDILVTLRRGEEGNGDEARPTVAILDAATGKSRQANAMSTGSWTPPLVSDVDRDGFPEILILGQDSGLYCLRHDLSLWWSDVTRPYARLVGAEELDRTGPRAQEAEIVGRSRDSLLVLSAKGAPRATAHLGGDAEALLIRAGGQWEMVASAGNELRFFVLRPGSPPWTSRRELIGVGAAGGLALGVILGLLPLLFRRQPRQQAEQMVADTESQERLLEAMVAFGHSGASLKVLDRLRFRLKNWERTSRQAGGGANPLGELVDAYHRSVLPDLVGLVSRARRARVSPEHWQRLVPRALAATSGLKALAGESAPPAKEEIARPLEALDDVDRFLRGIRTHLAEVYRTPLVATVGGAIGRWQPEAEKTGAQMRLEVWGGFDQSVFVSRGVLDKVLDNLLDNALSAMTSGPAAPGIRPAREIDITVSSSGTHCRIDVRDTACGIPQEKWQQIFDHSYTTKAEGGGFGLHYAKEALARYGGSILVHASEPGEGTTFRIILRASEGRAGSAVAEGVESDEVQP